MNMQEEQLIRNCPSEPIERNLADVMMTHDNESWTPTRPLCSADTISHYITITLQDSYRLLRHISRFA